MNDADTGRGRIETREYLRVVRPFYEFATREIVLPMLVLGGLTYASFTAMVHLGLATVAFWISAIVFCVSMVAGLLYYHSAVHLRSKRGIVEIVYNLLFGYPFAFASGASYTHVSRHHNPRFFGTANDTRYLPMIFYRNNAVALLSMIIVTPAMELFVGLLRMIVGGLYLLLPFAGCRSGLRKVLRAIQTRDAFAISLKAEEVNPRELRDIDAQLRQDLVTVTVQWAAVLLVVVGVLPWKFLLLYVFAILYFQVAITIQTSVEHGFENYLGEGVREMPISEFRELEMADSHTIEQTGFWGFPRSLLLGDSACYHALHHWYPAIPDVHLHRAHLALLKVLPEDHPYRATIQKGFLACFWKMLTTSRV